VGIEGGGPIHPSPAPLMAEEGCAGGPEAKCYSSSRISMEVSDMDQFEYKVAYVDFRGRISSEGVEFIRRSGEHRTGFVARYLTALGEEGWGVAGIHPLLRSETSYFVLQRPKQAVAASGDTPSASPGAEA